MTVAVNTCRYWLQGKLYPDLHRDEFLSLLMGLYDLNPVDARRALSEAEQAEQFADQFEIAVSN
jgi:hypothetical protein